MILLITVSWLGRSPPAEMFSFAGFILKGLIAAVMPKRLGSGRVDGFSRSTTTVTRLITTG